MIRRVRELNEVIRVSVHLLLAVVVVILAAPSGALGQTGAGEGETLPSFDKDFLPDTIGPGSSTTLVFTIENDSGEPVEDMAFTDVLPGDLVIATPASAINLCGGILTADDGDDTITLIDGGVGAGVTCTISVNITSGEGGEGALTNTTGDLTSSAGNSGAAEADLFVTDDLPGFYKSFDPASIPSGGTSTLTFTVDNSSNGSDIDRLVFVDNLPSDMVVATPANAFTDCENVLLPATVTAVPGSAVISLTAFGTLSFPVLGAEETCTVEVDVTIEAYGDFPNVSDELIVGSDAVSAGFATAILDGPLEFLNKVFVDNPAAPGGTTILEFTIQNPSRTESATDIEFTDDLSFLSGLTATLPSDPDPPCGAGSTLTGSVGDTFLTFAGGTLPPEGSCTFRVTLNVPAGAAPDTYTNTTTAVTATIGGDGVTGNAASDLLFVVPFPILTKEFTDDPVGAGDTVTLEFTITNPEDDSTMGEIAFTDLLTNNLPFPVSVTLPAAGFCGGGSLMALVSDGFDGQQLSMTGGSLAAAGMPGDSCTFSVLIDIPVGFGSGTYTNTTSDITAVLGSPLGVGEPVVGPPASDDLVVAGAPNLSKEFIDDPVLPGGTVTLEFTLEHGEGAPGDATGVGFTDDLAATLVGLTATGLPLADLCGPGNGTLTGSVGDTFLTVADITLLPGELCVFSVTLDVGAGVALGSHTNETSDVTATVSGVTTIGNPGSDDLLVTPLVFTKAFTDDPVFPGDTVTLEFTIENLSATDDATDMIFVDSLSGVLPGLEVSGAVPTTPCGPSSSIIGAPTLVILVDGEVLAGDPPCVFSVTLLVPPATPEDVYLNATSPLSATIGGTPVTLDAATDTLVVQSTYLELTKEFTDDPVQPGDPVTLEFTLTNVHPTDAASAIAFTDDLGAGLPGLILDSELTNTCGGTVAGTGTDMFDYSGGSLAAGVTCTISMSLTVPGGPLAGNVFTNTTSEVTATIAGFAATGNSASDDLTVFLQTFSKEFDGPSTATGSALLTFTLTNLDSVNSASGLAFLDDLDAVIPGLVASGLPAAACGGTIDGTSSLTFTGGSLAPEEVCFFAVTVDVPATAQAGDFLNTTSDLQAGGLTVADPATATLTIEPPPGFSKEFIPDSIDQGAVSLLVFTLDNTASALEAASLDFTDTLPAGLVVATPPNASTTCTGGTLTAAAGSGVISYTLGSVPAGASCTVEAEVTSGMVGIYVNVSGELTSSSGASGTATDTLEVVDAIPPQVDNVDSILGTGDGELEECETARTTITALTVAFNEAMFEAASTDPNSVTNPDNWLVVGSGPDQDLSTTVCGPPAGDDLAAVIDDVTYDGGSLTATVTFDQLLADAPYRLIACSGGLIDVNANALDGDGNGTGGDDFVRTFRVDRLDAFANGNFDCTLDHWVTSSLASGAAEGGGDIVYSTEDVDDASISGSAQFTNPAANLDLAIGQCVALQPESLYELSGFVRLNTAGVAIDSIRACGFYTSSDCSGMAIPAQAFITSVSTPGAWEGFADEAVTPAGVHSGLCVLTLRNAAGLVYSANADDVSMDLIALSTSIFQDGFESGDTSAWSSTVP